MLPVDHSDLVGLNTQFLQLLLGEVTEVFCDFLGHAFHGVFFQVSQFPLEVVAELLGVLEGAIGDHANGLDERKSGKRFGTDDVTARVDFRFTGFAVDDVELEDVFGHDYSLLS